MQIPSSKLPGAGTTIFTVMSQLSEDYDAINLSQGFPDFQPPEELLDRVSHHLAAGHNQYAPMTGVSVLRERIAEKISELYGTQPDPVEEVTVTSGATEALFCAIHAVVRSGEEVIVFDPSYDSYDPAIRLAGAVPIHIPLLPPQFEIDWDCLKQRLNERTRLVIINSPHNPTGSLLSCDDIQRLANVLRPYDTFVLSDEVYEHIVFDERRHASVLENEELAARSFAVFSFGKTYHATGWKVGYCVAPRELSVEFRRVHQFNTFTTTTPLQYALADYLIERPEHYLELGAFYEEKRNLFIELMDPSGFEMKPSKGTYFQLADYSKISSQPDMEFARWLTVEHRIAVIPISVFYEKPPAAQLIRFCFAKEAATLREAANRLLKL
jgi:methionine aminotransferase